MEPELKSVESSEKPGELSLTQEEMDVLPLKQFFDLKGNNYKLDKDLRIIMGWGMERGLKDRASLFTELRRMEMRLGAPELGESRVGRLARYLVLDGRVNNTLKEMSAYEHKS